MKKIVTLILSLTLFIFSNTSIAQCIQTNNIGYELNPAVPGQTVSLPSYPGTPNQGTIQAGNSFNSNLKAGYNYTFNGIAQGYVTLSNYSTGTVYYNGYPSTITGFTFTPSEDVVARFSYTADGPLSACGINTSRISPKITSACNSTITSTITSLAVIVQTVPAVCNGSTTISQRITVTPNGSLSYTYKWDNGEITPTTTALGAGMHTYTITGGCSGIYIGSITITGLQATLTASGGNFICKNNFKNLGVKWVSSSYRNETYLWNDGVTTYGPRSTSIPGTYFATVTNTQTGCVFETLPINLIADNALPTIAITSNQIEICSSNSVTIGSTGWLKNNPTNFTYLWSNGATGTSISTSSVGTFTLTMTDIQDGCTATSLPIEITTGNNRIIKATSTSFCPGSGIYPKLTAYNGSIRYVLTVLGTFNGSNPEDIIGAPNDGYIYDADGGTNNLLTETMNLSFTGSGPIGYVTLIASDSRGALTTPALSQIIFKARNPGTGLFETVAGINNGLPIEITGNYQRSFEFPQTAFDVTEMQIVFIKQSPSVIFLDAVSIGKTPSWSTSQIGTSIIVTTPGVYSVTSVNTCGVENAYQPITITTLPSTVILTQPVSQTLCGGSFGTFVVSTDGDNLAYAWSNGITTPTNTTAVAGVYTLSLTGTCGTVVSNQAVLTKYKPTSIVTQPVPQRICAGGSTGLSISAVGQNLSYLWSNGATTSSINTSIAGTYIITVTGYCGRQVSNPTDVIMKSPSSFLCSGITQPQFVTFKLPNPYRQANDTSRFGIVGIGISPFYVTDLVSGNSGNIVVLHSSNTAVATISSDNKIVTVGAGITTITGIQAASEDYDEASHSEILIVDPIIPKPTIAFTGSFTSNSDTLIIPWTTITGARTYCIKIYTDPFLSNLVASACGLTTTSYVFKIPAVGNIYYLQIAGVNETGTSPYSSPSKNIITVITGIDDSYFANNDLSLYPNPASDLFFIDGINNGTLISIYSMPGQLIYSGQYDQKGISIGGYPEGIYYVKVGSRSLKLVLK